jgi:hypothetical protein
MQKTTKLKSMKVEVVLVTTNWWHVIKPNEKKKLDVKFVCNESYGPFILWRQFL